jgi:penicillin-insensitive murein DD-endopeptidase
MAADRASARPPSEQRRCARWFCYDYRVRAFAIVMLLATVAEASPPTPWSQARTPAPGPARAIGTYGAGCITGAVALPLGGAGFVVAKPERKRVFGHPLLIAMIESVGKELSQLGLARLVVGDLGQPRGGPAPTGHASHQTGLDVDLFFAPPKAKEAMSMIDDAAQKPIAAFDAAVARVIALVAGDARVERLFINPILKRALCERTPTAERAWLRKVRPWYGHADHFHVRLACPADSPKCEPQAPLPPGDGCDALNWWFDAKAQADRAESKKQYSARVGAAPALPPDCNALLTP